MKSVIITGPTGAIGTALISYLVDKGIKVYAVCREESKRLDNIPQNPLVKIVKCNLNCLEKLPTLINDKDVDVLYHLGWEGTFGNSRNNVDGQLDNIKYTLDAVKAAYECGCKRFVGAGSQAEYGRVEGKLNAETPAFPENGYGIAKLASGQLSRLLCNQLGIDHVWTRILSIYGPYDGANTMVMSTIGKLLNDKKPALTKGEQMWDYLYSKDAAKALYLIGEAGISNKIYCMGSGKIKALREYIDTIREVVNPCAELGYGEVPYADKQVMYLCADISELKEDTGFEPDYSFEEGIRETVNWYKSYIMN